MFSLFSPQQNSTPVDLPPLLLFNTESRTIEEFTPLSKKEVRMYSCGPTVYDYAHIGNLRTYVFADTLKRALFFNGYSVNHTVNFTDFGHLTSDSDSGDDKMMKGLRREGMDISLESMNMLSQRYIQAFTEDSDALNIVPASQYPRASDFVREQIMLIETLAEKGYTYETTDGIYFDIKKFPTYGRLGNIDVDALKSGARVHENPEKKHPADFALWKKNPLLGFESKWGLGFPGWHIECSAMAFATLGKQIDIHTGGIDNIPTHHNGEIAQCESVTGKQFVRYWLHSEHLQIDNEKIAKSSGNGITLHTLYEQGFSALDYRYWLLTAHYRSKANFTIEALTGAKHAYEKLKKLMFIEWATEKGRPSSSYLRLFAQAINNDLNTPQALALVWDVIKDSSLSNGDKRATLLDFDSVFGLGLDTDIEEGARSLGFLSPHDIPVEIQTLVDQREAARIAHNWIEADRIRDVVGIKGFCVEDTNEGPKISRSNPQ